MIATRIETMKYYYVIHGTIPEVAPSVLCRRTRAAQREGRKMIKCPHCGKRLTDTDATTCVELYRHPVHVQVRCQFYMKCTHCKSEIGINIAV